MATPDPPRRALAPGGQDAGRLGVVHENEVVLFGELSGVLLGVGDVGRLLLLAQLERRSLEAVVHRLGDPEKALVSPDDPPVRHEAEVGEERHHRAQELGDAAAVRGGVHVQHPRSAERFGLLEQVVQQVVRGHASVGVQPAGSHVYGFEHSRAPCLAAYPGRGFDRASVHGRLLGVRPSARPSASARRAVACTLGVRAGRRRSAS